MNIGLLLSCLMVVLPITSLAADSAPQPWSPRVFEYAAREYGVDAEKRLHYLHDMVLANYTKSVPEKLKLVNHTLNKLPWIADANHWKQADYWATPLETITTFGGDCEDIAIVKWVMLNHLGISNKHLSLAYVKIKKTGENHMVLLYMEKPDAPPGQRKTLVLDNYLDEIRTPAQRTDLLAVYLADADGKLTLIADNGKDRTIKGVYEDRKMKRIIDLKEKIAENRRLLKELNDGQPLLPE